MLVDRDVPYGRAPGQRLDIHRDPRAHGAPVVVLIHGGGWFAGDKANADFAEAKAAHAVARGWVVVSVNYRLLPWTDVAGQAEDVQRALTAVRRHIARWGGDGARVCALGHSAGAHLAALAVAQAPGESGAPVGPPALAGLVLIDSATLDLPSAMQGPPRPLLRRVFGTDEGRWAALSPLHRLHGTPPPVLLVASTQREQALAQAEAFARRARSLGGPAEVHGFDLGHGELQRLYGAPGPLTDCIDHFLDNCAGQSLGKAHGSGS